MILKTQFEKEIKTETNENKFAYCKTSILCNNLTTDFVRSLHVAETVGTYSQFSGQLLLAKRMKSTYAFKEIKLFLLLQDTE